MLQQFGLDMFSSSFTGELTPSLPIQGKSSWIGEISVLGVVPPSEEVTGTPRPYSF